MKPFLNQAQGALKHLLEDAQLYQALLEVGRDVLPRKLQPHVLGISFEEQNLLVQIDEAVWATQLRFHEPDLLGIYQQHFPHLMLNRVKVKVLPQPPAPKRKPKIMVPPTKEDAKSMQELSEAVESEGLRNALQRLSQRAKDSSGN
ncbi:DciA family protein [Thiomicrorhabdus sediminis]|uniref:DUF721 domain-containing protein n=1 Tax=Thiomicrorhabdus sediminis TaxID=2580412 RepID=A0A4P9K6W2_9GAMM|nr:DciA family protein [Thiomicrorhabdus sediminis]QCU90621.1 DUF721 domain-containing protein [Thiomicrorhabdus sediminis]